MAVVGCAIWAWHDANDNVVPVAGSRAMIDALKKVGATPRYTEIPRGGHGVWTRTFADPEFFQWLFAQRKPE